MTAIQTNVRILIVEPEPQTAAELQTLLHHQGYESVVVQTAHDALIHLYSESFNIALINLWLLDMTGIDLLRKIKNLPDEIAVFLMGVQITPAIILEAINSGAVELLYKPFVAVSLIPKIEFLLNHNLPIEQNPTEKKSA
ncbi:MAG: response regulator [Acidobacteriota bacterium]